jgi:hypothetical protein
MAPMLHPITGKIENLGINEGENVIGLTWEIKGTPLFFNCPRG